MLLTPALPATLNGPVPAQISQIAGDQTDAGAALPFDMLLPVMQDIVITGTLPGNTATQPGKALPVTPEIAGPATAAPPIAMSVIADAVATNTTNPLPPTTDIVKPSSHGVPAPASAAVTPPSPLTLQVTETDIKTLSSAITAILPAKPDGAKSPPSGQAPQRLVSQAGTLAQLSPAIAAPLSVALEEPVKRAELPQVQASIAERVPRTKAIDEPRVSLQVPIPRHTDKAPSMIEMMPATTPQLTPVQQAAPATASAPAIAPAAPTATQPHTAAPPTATAERPTDFGTLIDRLVQARDAAAPASSTSVRAILSHADFGLVTMRFDQSGPNLAVAVSSNDPAFAHAAKAAVAADAATPRGEDHQRSHSSPSQNSNTAQSDAGGAQRNSGFAPGSQGGGPSANSGQHSGASDGVHETGDHARPASIHHSGTGIAGGRGLYV